MAAGSTQASEPTVPTARPTWDEIRAAAERIRRHVRRTPLVRAPRFPGLPDVPVYLKLENLQETGAFKLRGAINRIAQLPPESAQRGVVAASAGNHAQGVAWAARARGIPSTIVMAQNASPLKVRATEELGARVVLHGGDYEEAAVEAERLAREGGLAYIHPFDDPEVIAGQGTVGLEILEDLPDVCRVICGVGGGGLLAGITVAVKQTRPDIEIVGVQPTGADTLGESLRRGRVVVGGRPNTFADGLATRHIGDIAFGIFARNQVRAVSVDDRTIARAVFLLLERAKVLAEGAGAAPLAALLASPDLARDGPIVLVISGGNLDPFLLDRVLFIGLSAEGRLLRLRAVLPDAPGRLAEFLQVAASANANVRQIVHDRESPMLGPGEVSVEVELEVRDPHHTADVLDLYHRRGWLVDRVGPSDLVS